MPECADVECDVANCEECALSTVCTRCAEGFFFASHSECVSRCPPGTVPNDVHRQCDKASPSSFPVSTWHRRPDMNRTSEGANEAHQRERRNPMLFGNPVCNGTVRVVLTGSNAGASSILDTNPGQTNYNNNMLCTWLYTAPASSTVALQILKFTTESRYDFLTLFNNAGTQFARPSGTVAVNTLYLSAVSMRAQFNSDFSIVDVGIRAAAYWVCTSDTTFTLNAANSVFGSNSGPGTLTSINYRPSTTCTWILTPNAAGFHAGVIFDTVAFHIETGFDFVYVHEGTSMAGARLATGQGTTPPAAVTAAGASLTVQFVSNAVNQSTGFRATFVHVRKCCKEYADVNVLAQMPPVSSFFFVGPAARRWCRGFLFLVLFLCKWFTPAVSSASIAVLVCVGCPSISSTNFCTWCGCTSSSLTVFLFMDILKLDILFSLACLDQLGLTSKRNT
jgi:hypothetical protein